MQINKEILLPTLQQFGLKLNTIYPDFELVFQKTLFINEAHHVGTLVYPKTGYKRTFVKVNYRNIKPSGGIKVTLKFLVGNLGRKEFVELNTMTNYLESILTNQKFKTVIEDLRNTKMIYRVTGKNNKSYLSFNAEINKPTTAVSQDTITLDEIKTFVYDILEQDNNIAAIKVYEMLLDYFSIFKSDEEKINCLFNLAILLDKN